MKRLFIVPACLVFVSFSAAVLIADITTDLVAHWPLDKDANDSAGTNHGTLEDGASIIADVGRGRVLSLDGVDDYVNIPDSADFDITGDFTVAFWIKVPNDFDSSSVTCMPPLGKFENNNSMLVFTLVGEGFVSGMPDFMLPLQGSMVVKMEEKSASSAYFYTSTTTTSWAADTWYHVAGVYKDSEIAGSIYFNGVLEDSTESTDRTAMKLAEIDGPLQIGRCQLEQIGGLVHFFGGSIDDVRIYSRALSDADISELIAAGSSVEPAAKLAITWGAIKG